jgi:hypothetical protein
MGPVTAIGPNRCRDRGSGYSRCRPTQGTTGPFCTGRCRSARTTVRRQPRFRLSARQRARRGAAWHWHQGSASIRPRQGWANPASAPRTAGRTKGEALSEPAQLVPSSDSRAMKLVVVQERVYRLWDISSPRRCANTNREPDHKETWLLMAISDPMESGGIAAAPSFTSRRRSFTVSGGGR